MASGDKLNNKNLETVFGMFVERGGLNDFLAFPKRKSSLEHNWPDVNGNDIDLSSPTFEARQFTLKCALIATGENEQEKNDNFWNLYNGLFTELSGEGTHELYLSTIDRTYSVYYVDQASVSKVAYEDNRMIIKFDLIFQEADPFTNIQKVYLVDEDDNYLIA